MGELPVCYLGLGDDERAMDLSRKTEGVNYESRVARENQRPSFSQEVDVRNINLAYARIRVARDERTRASPDGAGAVGR